jgi:hypothetical protein
MDALKKGETAPNPLSGIDDAEGADFQFVSELLKQSKAQFERPESPRFSSVGEEFESHTRLTAHSGACIDTNLAFWVFSQFWAFTPFLALLPKSLPRTRLPSLFIYTCCFTHTCILPLVVPVHLRRR